MQWKPEGCLEGLGFRKHWSKCHHNLTIIYWVVKLKSMLSLFFLFEDLRIRQGFSWRSCCDMRLQEYSWAWVYGIPLRYFIFLGLHPVTSYRVFLWEYPFPDSSLLYVHLLKITLVPITSTALQLKLRGGEKWEEITSELYVS